MATTDPVHESLAAMARFMVGDVTVADALQRIVDLAATAVPAAASTGITMLVEHQVTTSVCSDRDVLEIDQAQYETGSGPCLDAFRAGETRVIASTETDTTWPEFSREALAHGIHSTLSLPLVAGDASLGAINFYSEAVNGFSEVDQEVGQVFATQAAIVLANTQAYWDARALSEHLTEAMASRATIEQAKGIIIVQSRVSPDEAFEILRMASQRENRKLREIARELVDRHGGRSPG